MIKANELRIGNHLYWKGEGICKVISVSQYGFKVVTPKGKHPDQDEYDHIEPIVLTPEWLERYGFEYHMPYYIFKSFIVSENRVRDGSGSYDGFHMKIRIEDRIIPMVIMHLHQLQNLYFALTSEELTIKQ